MEECINEIIEGSEIYNSELYLLICKSGYILDDNICVPKCYETCMLCTEFSMVISNQKCIECKEGYFLENGNCIKVQEITINSLKSDMHCLKAPNGDCIPTFPDGTNEFFLNNSLLESYTHNYITIDEFKYQIRKNISSYINSSKIIDGSNFLATILSSDDINPLIQLNNGISAFDLGNCTNVLKEHYEISEKENLMIINIEIKNDMNIDEYNSFKLNKKTQLEISINLINNSFKNYFCDNNI